MGVAVGVGSGVDATIGVGAGVAVGVRVGSGVGANVAVGIGASVGVGSGVGVVVAGLSSQAESNTTETRHSVNILAIQYLPMQHPFVASITTGWRILNRPQIRRD